MAQLAGRAIGSNPLPLCGRQRTTEVPSMSQRQLDVQHDEVKRRNRDRRLAEMAEAERLRAQRRERCGR